MQRVSGAKASPFRQDSAGFSRKRDVLGGGKAETEEVSADFWLLLFRDKSDPRRGAEYPL